MSSQYSSNPNGNETSIEVACLNNFERPQFVTLRVFPENGEHGQVLLVIQLGEAAWFSPDEARKLAGQLVVCAALVEELRARWQRSVEAAKASMSELGSRQAGV